MRSKPAVSLLLHEPTIPVGKSLRSNDVLMLAAGPLLKTPCQHLNNIGSISCVCIVNTPSPGSLLSDSPVWGGGGFAVLNKTAYPVSTRMRCRWPNTAAMLGQCGPTLNPVACLVVHYYTQAIILVDVAQVNHAHCHGRMTRWSASNDIHTCSDSKYGVLILKDAHSGKKGLCHSHWLASNDII